MLHPSYTELMNKINSDVEPGEQPLVESRYAIVKATSARARQIIAARHISEELEKAENEKIQEGRMVPEDEDDSLFSLKHSQLLTLKQGEPMIPDSDDMKPLSIAVEELYEGKVRIVGQTDDKQ
jgi:DNA-directed RNA polymerase subunit omega